jgi:hypothetical protein
MKAAAGAMSAVPMINREAGPRRARNQWRGSRIGMRVSIVVDVGRGARNRAP